MYQLMITIGILALIFLIPPSATPVHGAGCWVDYHPGNFAADWCLLPARQPSWFAAKRRFVDAERVLLRLRTPARKRNANWMKSVKVCRLKEWLGAI